MTICNHCSEETVKIEGLDFCHNCNKIVETETTEIGNKMELSSSTDMLGEIFQDWASIFGVQKN